VIPKVLHLISNFFGQFYIIVFLQAIVLLKKYSTHYKDKILYVTKKFLEKIFPIDYNLLAKKMPRGLRGEDCLKAVLPPRV